MRGLKATLIVVASCVAVALAALIGVRLLLSAVIPSGPSVAEVAAGRMPGVERVGAALVSGGLTYSQVQDVAAAEKLQLRYMYPAASPAKVWLWLPEGTATVGGSADPEVCFTLTRNGAGVFEPAVLDRCPGPPPLMRVQGFASASAVDPVVSDDVGLRVQARAEGLALNGIERSGESVAVTFDVDATEYTPEAPTACVRVVFTPSVVQPEAGSGESYPRRWGHAAELCDPA